MWPVEPPVAGLVLQALVVAASATVVNPSMECCRQFVGAVRSRGQPCAMRAGSCGTRRAAPATARGGWRIHETIIPAPHAIYNKDV